MKDMTMNNNEQYNQLLELQRKYRLGLIKDEDLTCKQKILLIRLYDMQMKKIEEANEKNLNKIMKYRKKIKF